MKVLVAGNGFIGRHLVDKLRENHAVKTLDRSNGTYEQDITDEFDIDDEFDVVFHTIGLAPGLYRKKKYRKVHVKGTRNLLEAVNTDKFVYISALGVGEIDHSYFKTKKEAEELVKEHCDNYTILRPSTVFGKGNKILGLIEKASTTRIFPGFSMEMQPIHVDDLVEILARSIDEFDRETLHLAGPEDMSLKELADKIYLSRGRKCITMPFAEDITKLGLRISPLPGFLSSENLELFSRKNLISHNDAEDIIGDLKSIR